MSGQYKNVVGYSPNDFFYISALDTSREVDIDCTNIDVGNLDGNIIGRIAGDNRIGNIMGEVDGNVAVQVYQHICKNKDLVNKVTNQKINHSGSQQAMDDSQTTFNSTILNTANLLIGIGFIAWSLSSGWMYR